MVTLEKVFSLPYCYYVEKGVLDPDILCKLFYQYCCFHDDIFNEPFSYYLEELNELELDNLTEEEKFENLEILNEELHRYYHPPKTLHKEKSRYQLGIK